MKAAAAATHIISLQESTYICTSHEDNLLFASSSYQIGFHFIHFFVKCLDCSDAKYKGWIIFSNFVYWMKGEAHFVPIVLKMAKFILNGLKVGNFTKWTSFIYFLWCRYYLDSCIWYYHYFVKIDLSASKDVFNVFVVTYSWITSSNLRLRRIIWVLSFLMLKKKSKLLHGWMSLTNVAFAEFQITFVSKFVTQHKLPRRLCV